MKVLIADPISAAGVEYLENLGKLDVANRPGLSPDQLLHEIENSDGLIVRSKTKVTSAVLEKARKLRVIGRAGTGVDNIDLDSATRKGILVMNTPGGNSVSAAEHAFALLMSAARKVAPADASLRSGKWNKSRFMGTEIQGKTLGVVGIGKIGSVLVRLARGFDLDILAYDPFVSEKYASDIGVKLTSLEDLLKNSDFVSLHLPLNDQTRGLICRSTLALMKKDALLINAARGGIIVEEDLADALEAGIIAGTALDVFEKEPQIHPRLLASDKAILTPHIAGSTVEAQTKVGMDIAKQVARYLTEEVIINAVNFPSISPKELARLAPYIELGEKLGSLVTQMSSIRMAEIGIRYYGELTQLDYKPISNYVLKAILKPVLSESINEVNARRYAMERGISVIETVSTRQRGHSNLISIQLRSPEKTDWVEGAILHQGNLWLVSIDGIPIEAPIGQNILVIRNNDRPGVIGKVGTILGENDINIASFVLGRDAQHPYAVGIVNTDSDISSDVLKKIRSIDAIQSAQVVSL